LAVARLAELPCFGVAVGEWECDTECPASTLFNALSVPRLFPELNGNKDGMLKE